MVGADLSEADLPKGDLTLSSTMAAAEADWRDATEELRGAAAGKLDHQQVSKAAQRTRQG